MLDELVKRIKEQHRLMEQREAELNGKNLMNDPEYRHVLGQWMGLKNAYSLFTGKKFDWDYE